MEDKAHTLEWSIQLLYDLHWAVKRNGLNTATGMSGLYEVLTSLVEQLRDSTIRIVELELEVNSLKALYAGGASNRSHGLVAMADQSLSAI
jgi:hypothetical protein